MNIAEKLIDYSTRLSFSELPDEVVHEAKRALLDTLGCAIGAIKSDAYQILMRVIDKFNISGDSTIIGSNRKTLPHYAALVNGILVRYWDYNDAYVIPMGSMLAASHPSDTIPTILALGELEGINGKELLTNIVLGYELSGRFIEAISKKPLENRGWNMDCRGPFITPIISGRIMGLNPDQIKNAFGISGSRDMILGILDAEGEVYTMAKNMRFAYTGHNGILSAFLAKEGFTGPARAMEGNKGFIDTVLKGDFIVEKLISKNTKESYKIIFTEYKPFPANRSSHGHISATLNIVNQHNIDPKDIYQVNIYTSTRVAKHTGDESKKYPVNKESADHSAYYLTAIAIIDKEVGLNQFSSHKYSDPKVKELIDKVSIQAEPSLDPLVSAGISEIITNNGNKYTHRVDYPKGKKPFPMSDEDLENKFTSLASNYMEKTHIDKIIKDIWRLEYIENINQLINNLRIPQQ